MADRGDTKAYEGKESAKTDVDCKAENPTNKINPVRIVYKCIKCGKIHKYCSDGQRCNHAK